jgi:arabinan endo-1,5-alpha-L-arabinosidase
LASVAATKSPQECDCAVAQQPSEESTTEPGAHDPVVVKEGRRYYLFVTGPGIPFRSSPDLQHWGPVGKVFDTPPDWAPKTIVGFREHIWAPDVSFFGGKWHLYYAVSTFGKNRSAIGHATNKTLDPTSKNYRWVDHGPVVQSYPIDDYNAIDPNAVVDAKGTPWLSFGSFWNGIELVRLTRDGERAEPDAKPVNIAARPHEGPQQPGAIEAPYIVRRGDYYYLFASFDFCCRGANSTYNVRVGRSKDVQGPYLDRDGKPMTEGGGTKVIEGGTRWKGPGHEAVLRDGKSDILVYHAYDAENRGRPMLRMSKITWDREGWPSVPPPG